ESETCHTVPRCPMDYKSTVRPRRGQGRAARARSSGSTRKKTQSSQRPSSLQVVATAVGEPQRRAAGRGAAEHEDGAAPSHRTRLAVHLERGRLVDSERQQAAPRSEILFERGLHLELGEMRLDQDVSERADARGTRVADDEIRGGRNPEVRARRG